MTSLMLLREAARRLRAQATAGNPNPYARPDVDRALADWLDDVADRGASRISFALNVARAVVGGDRS